MVGHIVLGYSVLQFGWFLISWQPPWGGSNSTLKSGWSILSAAHTGVFSWNCTAPFALCEHHLGLWWHHSLEAGQSSVVFWALLAPWHWPSFQFLCGCLLRPPRNMSAFLHWWWSPWHPSPSKCGRGPWTLRCGSNRNQGVLSTMSRWHRPEWSEALHLISALGKGWRRHLAPGPISRTIPGHMSGLITPVAANSCQSPPAVLRNVALAITPITHDPTTRARPLRQSVITRCGLRNGNYRIPQLGIVLHHGPGPVYQVIKGQQVYAWARLQELLCSGWEPCQKLVCQGPLGSPPNNTISFVSSAKYTSTVLPGCNALASNCSQAVAGSIANALYSAALILS